MTSHPTLEYPYAAPPPPPTPPAAPPPTQALPRRRGGFAAAVVAASLVAGGGAGFGGAALWSATQDDSPAPAPTASAAPSTASTAQTAPVSTGSVAGVAKAVLPSVVKIDVSSAQEAGSGSGIILSADGVILTNNHVAAVAGTSGTIEVSFNDGSHASAKILGTDPLTDTAVIKADGVSGLKPATIGKSSSLQVGQEVVAVGSPFGLESTVTSGIVSALNRPVNVGSDGAGNSTTYPAIQTDAAINPGNSGGPLVDMSGRVVGINSSIRTASTTGTESGSIGLGFAIPIDEVMPIVDQMTNGETPTHARMGVTVSDVQSASDLGEGALVQSVTTGGAAAKAGLTQGAVITKIDDHLITSADSLVATIRSYRPGDTVTVTWQVNGNAKSASVRLDSDAG